MVRLAAETCEKLADKMSGQDFSDLIYVPRCEGQNSISIKEFHKRDFVLYIRYALIQKKTILFGNFSQHGRGGLPKSQNFCKFTKYFFVCQIHSEVLKHVLQMGG